jgi:hypothetical protein
MTWNVDVVARDPWGLTSNDIAHKQTHGSNVHKGIGEDSKNTMYDESTREGDN